MNPPSLHVAISAAAVLAAGIVFVRGGGHGVEAAAAVHDGRRPPPLQRRVRSATRRVPYAEDHPLGRHLLENGGMREAGGYSRMNVVDDDSYNDGSVVGGDGSRSSPRQRRRRRTMEGEARGGRFLRFSPPPHQRHEKEEDESPFLPEAALLVDAYHIEYENEEAANSEGGGGGGERDDGGEGVEGGVEGGERGGERGDANGGGGDAVQSSSSISDEEGGRGDGEGASDEGQDVDVREESDQSMESSLQGDDNVEYDGSSSSSSFKSIPSSSPSSLYQPMRLRAIFTDDDTSGFNHLTPSQREILMEDIINPALSAWGMALHVVPVHPDGKLVVDKSQLYDGVSCGPGLDSGMPSVRVPIEHTTSGLEDTDAVIYVSVSFSESAIAESLVNGVESTISAAASPGSTTAPSSTSSSLYHLHRGATGPEYVGADKYSNETITSPTTVAAFSSELQSSPPTSTPSEMEPNVDSRPICTATYLASATYCSTDQYDRPVAGMLSLCIPSAHLHNFFHDPDQIERNVVTVMHEIGHVLGFNAHSLANVRDPDTGHPLTPRDANGDVPYGPVECTGVSPRMYSNVPLPSYDVLQFRTVRGGVRVAVITTPTVVRVARNMFGCRTLPGAELESGEGRLSLDDYLVVEPTVPQWRSLVAASPGECIGDHWSRRLFRTDLMNAMVDDVPYSLYISSLTLAYFADTGWYKVDADRIAPASIWGRNAGCDFVEEQCISSNGHVTAGNNPFFCDNFLEESSSSENDEEDWSTNNGSIMDEREEEVMEIHGCSLDSSRKAVCSLVEYDSTLPTEFDYFKGDVELDHSLSYGGRDPTLDFCPVFEGFANGQCDDENSKELMLVSNHLEVFGKNNSRCVIGRVNKKRTALCLPIACVIQEQSLMVKIDGYWKPCSYAGQIISVWWNPNDYVVCPDPSRMCPTFFCPQDCFREGGICDFQTGQCMCEVASTNSSFTSNNIYPHFEPCSPEGLLHLVGSGETFQVVERINFELPEYYVENITVLLDDPRQFEEKVSRMFAQLSSGEVVGLLASFVMCAILSYMLWTELVKCYKRRNLVVKSLSKAKSSVGSLSGMLSRASRASLNDFGDDNNERDSTVSRGRSRRSSRNPQKDKMVATLLVQMRTEGANTGSPTFTATPTIVNLSSPTVEEVLVYRSDLPQLPDGARVLAVVGARIVEDHIEIDEDRTSSATSATHTSQSVASSHPNGTLSEFISPLFQDPYDEREVGVRSMLRLRRQMD